MGQITTGVWGREPPAGSRGGTPVGGLGTKSPEAEEILKVVTSKFYAFLVVYHTFHLYLPMFLPCRQALSLRNGEGGICYRYVCPPPPVSKWGQLPPLPLAPPPMHIGPFTMEH